MFLNRNNDSQQFTIGTLRTSSTLFGSGGNHIKKTWDDLVSIAVAKRTLSIDSHRFHFDVTYFFANPKTDSSALFNYESSIIELNLLKAKVRFSRTGTTLTIT